MAKKKKQSNSKGIAGVVAGIVIIVAAVVIVSLLNGGNAGMTDEVSEETTEVSGNTVLVTVNGQDITRNDLNKEYEKIPVQVRGLISEEQFLDEVINQVLLIQEAKSLGIEATPEEVQEFVDIIKEQNGLTEEQMNDALVAQGLSMEQFLDDVKKQIVTQKLFEQSLGVEVSEEEVLKEYEMLEPVIVRHILLTAKENETNDELFARALSVQEEISEDKSNFCDLVGKYTQDKASIATCGEYLVSADSQFVPEFEAAAYELDDGEISTVASQFGIHIFWKVGVPSFEEFSEQIKERIIAEKTRDKVSDYVVALREKASIVYPTKDSVKVTGNVVGEDPILVDVEDLETPEDSAGEEIVDEETDETIVEQVTEDELMEEETTGENVEEEPYNEAIEEEVMIEETTEDEVVQEIPEEVTEEVTEDEAVQEIPEEVTEEESMQETEELEPSSEVEYTGTVSDSIVACLENKGVELYGANWDSQTKMQLQIFKEMPSFYTECFEEGSFRNKKAVCDDIKAFPTWKIGGQRVIGRLSINSLLAMSDC